MTRSAAFRYGPLGVAFTIGLSDALSSFAISHSSGDGDLDAAATDPACHKSPHHTRVAALAAAEADAGAGPIRWRSFKEKVEV
jgi:hypothetical protein